MEHPPSQHHVVISNREPERLGPGKAELRSVILPRHGRVNQCRGAPVPGGSGTPQQRRLRDVSPLSRLLPFANSSVSVVADALGLNHRDLLWRASPRHLLHTEYLLFLSLWPHCPSPAITSQVEIAGAAPTEARDSCLLSARLSATHLPCRRWRKG